MILLASILEGLAYAAAAVFVRRRFAEKGLLVFAIASAVLLSAAVFLARPISGDFLREVPQLAVSGTIVGVISSSIVIDRFLKRHPDPDPPPEIALGGAVFVAGFWVGLFLAGSTVVVIG